MDILDGLEKILNWILGRSFLQRQEIEGMEVVFLFLRFKKFALFSCFLPGDNICLRKVYAVFH